MEAMNYIAVVVMVLETVKLKVSLTVEKFRFDYLRYEEK